MADTEDVSWVDALNSFSVRAKHHYHKHVRSPVEDQTQKLRKRFKIDPRLDQARGVFKAQVAKLDKKFSAESVITRTEKIWFAFSLLNIFYFGYLIGKHPKYVHVVYTIELALLLPVRFYTYHKRNWQYYCADLCYFVNLLALLFIWVWPQSRRLWVSCFSFSFGTLCFAILTWRNSLVLHSVDKTTSCFIHILPPVVFHCINHRLPEDYKQQRFPGAAAQQDWQVVNGLIQTTFAYFVWQSLYHYFITIRKASQIEAGRITSFEYMRRHYAKAWIGRFVNSLPGPLPVLTFTMIQFGYQILTMLPCPLWYRYEWLSSIFLTCIFAIASYNGATYYIDVFGQRFHKELKRLQEEMDQLEDRLVEQATETYSETRSSRKSSGETLLSAADTHTSSADLKADLKSDLKADLKADPNVDLQADLKTNLKNKHQSPSNSVISLDEH